MGFLDDFFDCKIVDARDAKITYTPVSTRDVAKTTKDIINGTKGLVNGTKGFINGTKTVTNKTKQYISSCNSFAYNMVADWCSVLKGTDFHKQCLNLIFEGLDDGVGVYVCDYVRTLNIDFFDYWYEEENLEGYTRSQLKKVEKELDKGKYSLDLCLEMLDYAWKTIVPKDSWDNRIDDNFIYKLRVRWLK